MDEKDKLSGIADYLKELFPGCVIENIWDSKSRKYVFRVDAPTGKTKHTIRINPNVAYLNRPKPINSRQCTPSAPVLASGRTSRTVKYASVCPNLREATSGAP
jgi:hypothetical protein